MLHSDSPYFILENYLYYRWGQVKKICSGMLRINKLKKSKKHGFNILDKGIIAFKLKVLESNGAAWFLK